MNDIKSTLERLGYIVFRANVGKVKPNRPSPKQLTFIENMRFNGFTADVVYSVQEAVRLVDEPLMAI